MEEDVEFQAVIDRLKRAMGVQTNKAVAEGLGLTASNLGERKTRGALPTREIDAYCAESHVNRDWVYGGVGTMWSDADAAPRGERAQRAIALLQEATSAARALSLPDEEARLVQEFLINVSLGERSRVRELVAKLSLVAAPRYDIAASAGNGSVINMKDDAVVDFLAFQPGWLQEIGCKPGHVAVISVRGDSMADTLNDGDLILVDTRPPERKAPGIYVLVRDDTLLVKRLNFRLNGNVEIKSDNRAYPTETMSRDDFERLHVVGRVVRRVVR